MTIEIEKAVLIAGGYGVVGSQLARLFRQRHPDIPLLLGGRHPKVANAFAKEIGNAKAVKLDVTLKNPLADLGGNPIAILNAVNDLDNHLLIDSINKSIAFVDITRWTDKMREAMVTTSMAHIRAPIVLSSGWMAGVVATIAATASQEFSVVESIDIDILYGMADKAGPNSAEYMDRMAIPFEIMIDGKKEQKYPFSDPKMVVFPSGFKGKVYRFDVPDQMTLPALVGAQSVSGRIGFDNAFATRSLALLTKYGIMRLLDRPIFDSIRKSLLYSPGTGAAHQIIINIIGINGTGQTQTMSVSIVDAKGQTHLTALGAMIQLERVLAVDGRKALVAGVHFPEQNTQFSAALSLLRENGVRIKGLKTAD